jgi:hypothetical protein
MTAKSASPSRAMTWSGVTARRMVRHALAELTTRQRRELDDEAALVGAVMEATPTLTVGPVTVGPHA